MQHQMEIVVTFFFTIDVEDVNRVSYTLDLPNPTLNIFDQDSNKTRYLPTDRDVDTMIPSLDDEE